MTFLIPMDLPDLSILWSLLLLSYVSSSSDTVTMDGPRGGAPVKDSVVVGLLFLCVLCRQNVFV